MIDYLMIMFIKYRCMTLTKVYLEDITHLTIYRLTRRKKCTQYFII